MAECKGYECEVTTVRVRVLYCNVIVYGFVILKVEYDTSRFEHTHTHTHTAHSGRAGNSQALSPDYGTQSAHRRS